jgi:hypothetical protein
MKIFLAFAALAHTVAGFGNLVNPCNENNVEKPPIWTDLGNVPCFDENGNVNAAVQSGADVTEGSAGLLEADLDPIDSRYTETCTDLGCMCPVNVHWHLGAEHYNEGTFDLDGDAWMAAHGSDSHRKLAGEVEPGNFCPGYDENDLAYTTEYEWQYCTDMHVGYTYEIHWPHSNLGACGTEWQFQSHFMDGVLCFANANGLSTPDALGAVFDSQVAKIGVQAQVFTVVNDEAYDYPEWNPLYSWNTDLAENVAIYQGSTTGLNEGNVVCRGTGGAVTWQVDRGCHKISARAFDRLCMLMLEQTDDMSSDVYPHTARDTVIPELTTNEEMGPGVDFGY